MSKIQIASGNEEFKAKEQLYALFYELTSEIKGKEIELDEDQYINNINSITLPQLIDYLRNTIQILIKRQIDNARRSSRETSAPISNEDRMKYEQIIAHLENAEKHHIRRFFEQKTMKEILESRLMESMEMEKEFDILKEKVKYEEGRFLKNERKDNEIIIIRAENTILKKAIIDFEEKEGTYIKEITDQKSLIEQLKESIEEQRNELERTRKDLKLYSNININISNSGNNTATATAISSNNNNQSRCAICGCHGKLSPERRKHTIVLPFKDDQTQFKMFNMKKVNTQNSKSKIQYNLNQMNGSLSNSHITFDLFSNKASSSTSKNMTLQHNNSMNTILDKVKGESLTKNITSSRLINNNKNINPYCMKITKMPINQSRCPIINSNSLSKRDLASNKIVLSKKSSALINNKSQMNSTFSRGEEKPNL